MLFLCAVGAVSRWPVSRHCRGWAIHLSWGILQWQKCWSDSGRKWGLSWGHKLRTRALRQKCWSDSGRKVGLSWGHKLRTRALGCAHRFYLWGRCVNTVGVIWKIVTDGERLKTSRELTSGAIVCTTPPPPEEKKVCLLMMEDRAGGGLETLRYCLGVAEQREWKPWLLALLIKEEEDLNPRKLWCVCVCVCVCWKWWERCWMKCCRLSIIIFCRNLYIFSFLVRFGLTRFGVSA